MSHQNHIIKHQNAEQMQNAQWKGTVKLMI